MKEKRDIAEVEARAGVETITFKDKEDLKISINHINHDMMK